MDKFITLMHALATLISKNSILFLHILIKPVRKYNGRFRDRYIHTYIHTYLWNIAVGRFATRSGDPRRRPGHYSAVCGDRLHTVHTYIHTYIGLTFSYQQRMHMDLFTRKSLVYIETEIVRITSYNVHTDIHTYIHTYIHTLHLSRPARSEIIHETLVPMRRNTCNHMLHDS